MQAVKGISMEKWLCWGSMGVAGLVLLLFILDLVNGMTFKKVSVPVDIVGALACGVVIYLAWDAYKDVR